MISVDVTGSSLMHKCEYDEENQCLHIHFVKGGAYKYSDFDRKAFDALLNSESKGKHFHSHVKPHYKHEKL